MKTRTHPDVVLVGAGIMSATDIFIRQAPHMSFVRGQDSLDFLRYATKNCASTKGMIPSLGASLAKDANLSDQISSRTNRILQLSEGHARSSLK